jgi:hypothetical protein
LRYQILRQPAGHGQNDTDRLAFRPEPQHRPQPAIGDIYHIVEDGLHGSDAATPGDIQAFFFSAAETGRCRAGQIIDAKGRSGPGGEADG